jgi:SAM-dependent methyltransferase
MTQARDVAYYDEFAREYALFFTDLAHNMAGEGDWLDAVLRDRGVRTVLDASCGTGRQAIPLAQRGYEVTGADPSGAMLQEAEKVAAARKARVSWIQASFTDLPSVLNTQFDAVIALGNGLCNQESPKDIGASLRALRRCVRPGGVCLVGIKDYEAIRGDRERFHGHRIRDDEGGRSLLFEVWDFEDPILVSTAYCLRGRDDDWTVHSASTREYMLGAREMERLAREAGFGCMERLDHPSEAVYALAEDGAA